MIMSETEAKMEQKGTGPWYALRTFNCQEQKVSRFLTQQGCTHFVPMFLQRNPKDPTQNQLVPAVHNLLFVRKQGTERQMLQLLQECPIPNYILRRPGENRLCEIPDYEMRELRMLCDPEFHHPVYLEPEEAETMIGKEVRVEAGPFKGMTGRLVRKQKQYYFLKLFIGMGVMVRISRWYCKPLMK